MVRNVGHERILDFRLNREVVIMKNNSIYPGALVRVENLNDAKRLFVDDMYLIHRKKSVIGVVRGPIPGHSEDVCFVEHNGLVCAYSNDEITNIGDFDKDENIFEVS